MFNLLIKGYNDAYNNQTKKKRSEIENQRRSKTAALHQKRDDK